MMNVFRMFFYWPTTLTSFCDHPKLIISTEVMRVGSTTFCYPFLTIPLGDLYLISEKSIWKNQFRWTGFLVYFELDFYCLCRQQKSVSKLIFAGKNSSSSKLNFHTWFFKNQVQMDKANKSCIFSYVTAAWIVCYITEKWPKWSQIDPFFAI